MDNKELKVLFGALVFTFLLIIGLSFLIGGDKELGEVQGLSVTPEFHEMGDVPINGGLVTKEFEVKNDTDEKLTLKRVATSCMCTEAKVVFEEKETPFFGMEHATDKNPPVNLEFSPGEKAKVLVSFDPAAHGPEGAGPFDREVWLTFSDPAGVKTLSFSGRVIAE